MAVPDALKTEMNSVNKATPVIVAHGLLDDVVPVAAGKAAFNSLKYAGFQVKWFEYRMAHSVCAQEVDDLSRFIQAQLIQQAE
jgi:phospholipase/carboxylesterase